MCLSLKIQFKNFSNFLFCQVVRSFLTILKSLSVCLLLEGNINTAWLPVAASCTEKCRDRLPADNTLELNTRSCPGGCLLTARQMFVMVLPSLCCILKMFPALNWYHLSRGYLVTTIFINKTHIFSFSFLSTLSWEIDCKMWKCCEEGTRTLSFSTAIKWGVTEAGVVKETKVKFRWFESWEVWEGWETLVIKYNYCQPASLPLETRLSHLTAPRTLSNINHILSFSSHSAGPVVSIISCFCSQQILLWSNILDYWKCWISNDASLNFSIQSTIK